MLQTAAMHLTRACRQRSRFVTLLALLRPPGISPIPGCCPCLAFGLHIETNLETMPFLGSLRPSRLKARNASQAFGRLYGKLRDAESRLREASQSLGKPKGGEAQGFQGCSRTFGPGGPILHANQKGGLELWAFLSFQHSGAFGVSAWQPRSEHQEHSVLLHALELRTPEMT